MPKARFFTEDIDGNSILIAEFDFDTKQFKKYISDKEYAEQRIKNTKRLKDAVTDIVMQNPESNILKM